MELLAQVVGNLIEPVRLSEVHVVDGYSRLRQVPVLWVLRAGLGNQKVEKFVITLVLRLVDDGVSICVAMALLSCDSLWHCSPPSCC